MTILYNLIMINLLLKSLKQQWAALINHGHSTHRYISLEIALEDNFPIAAAESVEHFFLNKSTEQLRLLGLGNLLTISATGEQRFDVLKSRFKKLLPEWQNRQTVPPLAFIAFAFDENDSMSDDWQDLPNSLLKIPQILLKQTTAGKTLQVNLTLESATLKDPFEKVSVLLSDYLADISLHQQKPLKPGIKKHSIQPQPLTELNDRQQWNTLSLDALEAIHKGRFDKLVTSRQQWVQLEKPASINQLTQKLISHYPACSILSFFSADKKLIAASPERLISLQHPIIKSDAIGGTILRPSADQNGQQQILHTIDDNPEYHKLRKEHAFIAQDIYQRLDPLCHSLKMPCSPYLMKLYNMYHLETPVQGILQDQFDLFNVIEALHPTPAIAGFPARQARKWLLSNETRQRGWYTGAFGWLDADMNGELSVMLRCALFNQHQAHLFAGAGLIDESDPEIEWQETELKMQTILEML